jgi:hypothetical protein
VLTFSGLAFGGVWNIPLSITFKRYIEDKCFLVKAETNFQSAQQAKGLNDNRRPPADAIAPCYAAVLD